jgi:hypothetical protein
MKKKVTLEEKARNQAASFYLRPDRINGYVVDWIEGRDDGPMVDQDIKDLAKLLARFHKECNNEKL